MGSKYFKHISELDLIINYSMTAIIPSQRLVYKQRGQQSRGYLLLMSTSGIKSDVNNNPFPSKKQKAKKNYGQVINMALTFQCKDSSIGIH